MSQAQSDGRFVFPRWANLLLPGAILLALGGAAYVPLVVYSAGTPRTTAIGYQPVQPVEYSHALHVGQLGLDCRYCHTTVEQAAFAAIPPTQTCMNCHATIRSDSPRLLPIRESYISGMPVAWIKVHRLPDYVYFDHSAHVTRGIGCVTCHGRIDKMDRVYQVNTLSMAWCLDCHRGPAGNLRPLEAITEMNWIPQANPAELGKRLMETYNIRNTEYMTNCSLCHR